MGAAVPTASARLNLGNLTLTMPNISLNTSALGPQGGLVATTNNFIPGSIQDNNRQIFAISVNPLAILGQGTYSASIAGIFKIAVTTLEFDVKAAESLDQTMIAAPNPSMVTFAFTDSSIRPARDGDPHREWRDRSSRHVRYVHSR